MEKRLVRDVLRPKNGLGKSLRSSFLFFPFGVLNVLIPSPQTNLVETYKAFLKTAFSIAASLLSIEGLFITSRRYLLSKV